MDGIFVNSSISEDERYLGSARESAELDPLKYWAANKGTYPRLYVLAKTVRKLSLRAEPEWCKLNLRAEPKWCKLKLKLKLGNSRKFS